MKTRRVSLLLVFVSITLLGLHVGACDASGRAGYGRAALAELANDRAADAWSRFNSRDTGKGRSTQSIIVLAKFL